MKKLETHVSLIFWAFLGSSLGTWLLFKYVSLPPLLSPLLGLVIGATAVVFCLSFKQHDNLPIAKRYTFFNWILRIVTIELSFTFIAVGWYQFITFIQPNFNSVNLHVSSFFLWGMLALLTAAFSYHAFSQKKDTYFSTLLFNSEKITASHWLGILVNGCTRAAVMTAFSTTLILLATVISAPLMVTSLANTSLGLTLIIGLFLALTIYQKGFNHYLRRLLIKKQGSIQAVILSGLIILVLLFTLHNPAYSHYALKVFTQPTSYGLLLVVITGWLPILSSYLAFISKGYSLRALLLALLIPAALISFLLSLIPIKFFLHPTSSALLTLLGFICILFLTFKRDVRWLWLDLCLRPELLKFRAINSWLKRICILTLFFTYVSWLVGWAALTVLLWVFLLPSLLLMVTIIFTFTIQLIRARLKRNF